MKRYKDGLWKTIDESLLIPQLSSGDKLFHYTTTEGLLGISNGEFWATERGFLNDYTEFQIATDVFCEILHSRMENAEKREKVQNILHETVDFLQSPVLTKDNKRKFIGDYVLSFCLEENSPFMWSSYSNHMGYSLRFDYEKLIMAIRDVVERGRIDGKVVYNKDEQVACLEETVKRGYFDNDKYNYINTWDDIDLLSDEDIEEWSSSIAIEISFYNMFFKKACFASEQEYRVVINVWLLQMGIYQ